jgi:hypothetical protein
MAQGARSATALLLLAVGGCGEHKTAEKTPQVAAQAVATAPASGLAASVASTSSNPLLGKAAVQEAIRLALKTGQNQRWEDGGLSGYAVPSLTTMANGCRTVRYTVDQRPDEPVMTINACDASGAGRATTTP